MSPHDAAHEAPLREASDPATPPARLERLSCHRDEGVRRAVAGNPNAPTETLLRLAALWPEATLANPILDLLLLENPNWLGEMPAYARQALLASPEAPAGFLRWAVAWGDADALLAVAANPQTPAATLERLREHDDGRVAEAAGLHANAPARPGAAEGPNPGTPGSFAFADVIRSPELERDRELLKDLLAAGAAPAWLLELLAGDADAELRACVAAQAEATGEALARLSADEDEEVRRAARANPNCPASAIALHARLERGDDTLSAAELEAAMPIGAWALRQCASHPNTRPETLERFVADEDWRVRQAVAQNRALPAAHLLALSADSDRDVRAAVAGNPNATPAILEPLLGDTSDDVRSAALTHPNAPTHVLADLERARAGDAALGPRELEALSSRGEWARRLAAQHPNMPPEALERDAGSDDWHTRQAVARNPNTPAAALAKLSEDADADVRGAAAANPSLPFGTLEALSNDVNHEVRKAVATNPKVTPALLAFLADDSNWVVRQAVAANPATPPASLERLATDSDRDVKQAVADNPAIPERAIEVLFSQWFAGLEGVTGSLLDLYRRARQPDADLPGAVLEQLAAGGEWARLLAARHPATPPAALALLAQEEDWRVRQAVAQNAGAPQAVLEALAQDSDHDVRTGVAQHAGSTAAILERLAQDGHLSVRRAVLERPDLTPAVLEHLCMDEDDELRELANRHEAAPRAALDRYRALERAEEGLTPDELERFAALGLHARKLAVRHPNASRALLERAAGDESWLVRQAAAHNGHAPAAVLESLAADPDRDVRSTVAQNRGLPAATLELLLRDADDGVRRAALGNGGLSPSMREAQRRRVVAQQLRSRDRLNRMIGLAHGLASAHELRKRRNAQALDWRDRLAVTANPNAPTAVLERLALDANRAVRDAARLALEARRAQGPWLEEGGGTP